jgi:hypothetical protein
LKKYFLILLTCFFIACSSEPKGFEQIEDLYRSGVAAIKSKNQTSLRAFVEQITPNESTADYLAERRCNYRGFPKELAKNPDILPKIRLQLAESLYRFASRLDEQGKLNDLQFVKMRYNYPPEGNAVLDCPDILFTEDFALCVSQKDTIVFSFGELLKIKQEWKSFTDYKLN